MVKHKQNDSFSLESLRNGDRGEFSRMVESFSPFIYRLGMKILNNQQDAEDILQETFIKAFRHIKDFDGRSKLSTWLYRIATNEALMLLRKKYPDTISVNGSDDDVEENQKPINLVDWCCLPEEELMSAESMNVLNRSVGRLSTNLRLVFILRDIEGLSTRETAQVLDLSEAAVKTRLSRARFQLREDLSAYFSDRLEEQLYG
ncbi:MAG: sigma-70 family RNA polymerase sigma factor [Anaerolineales bacterium]|nr:sigma-70 family RNA polymerase sigma factor [Anaerolineales bacterium]